MQNLHDIFTYKEGYLYWKVSPAKNIKIGDVAGTKLKDGYVAIRYKGRGYKAHRLIWQYHNQLLLEATIDHINGNRCDNRIENLRNVSQSQNAKNRKHSKGWCFSKKTKKYQAQVEHNGRKIWLGYFDTKEQAYLAYKTHKEFLYGHS